MKLPLILLFCCGLSSLWSQTFDDTNTFIMGQTDRTDLCEGTLLDSGGEANDYAPNEDVSFTVCPTTNECVEIGVNTYHTEREYDFLYLYEGENTEGKLLATINGQGFQTLTNVQNNCFTVHFTSDASQQRSGFDLSWKCATDPCIEVPETDCNNPPIITQLPFQAVGLTTCLAGNNLEIGVCGNDNFIKGNDYIFVYDSPGKECISINLSGFIPNAGIAIFRNCPSSREAFCINQKKGDELGSDLSLSNISLKEAGRYFFVIAHKINCTPFSIEIFPSDNCPNVFPSAATCEKGLILNGCNPDLPAALSVEPASGDSSFFQLGINNGCWENVFSTNYTWFTFEAQGDGNFAFLLSNNDPNEVVDIDFNIWGPFDNLEDACFGAETMQPIRSSWAENSAYSVTGLTNVNPELGEVISDTCEGIEGDGFLKPLVVIKGEVYTILINDFDGVIFSGAIAIDFKGSDPQVLSNIEENSSNFRDTIICQGESLPLNPTVSAATYEWSPGENLSCTGCPNPIATPITTTNYSLTAKTVCQTINGTMEVAVTDFNQTNISNIGESEIFVGEKVESIILSTTLENIINIDWLENGKIIAEQKDSILSYIPLCNQPISNNSQMMEITAEITTVDGCTFLTNTIEILVKPPVVANAFTPGDDGKNDYFNILIPKPTQNVIAFRVYNRWGKIVYDNNAPEMGWDGRLKNNGDLMPTGVYTYYFQYKNNAVVETLRGNVTLIR